MKKCPVDIRKKYLKEYYQKNKERIKQKRDDNIEEFRKIARVQETAYRHKWRWKILEILGNKCIRCDNDDGRVLQVDHVRGGGKTHNRTFKGNRWSYYRQIFIEIEGGSKDYQILCANCNWIKRFENQEYKKVQ